MRFESYHPTINLLFFVSVMAFSLMFTQPVFLLIGYICAFIYSSYLGKAKAVVLNVIAFVFIIMYAFYYSSYNHFGVTNLTLNFIGNAITLESVYAGFVEGIHIASVVMWFYCVIKIVTSDKVIYLLGRVWPRLSLFVSILLRFVPQIVNRFRCVNRAQTAIGRGISQGKLLKKIRNMIRVLSIVITWSLESFVESSMSMKSRGYTLRGRTAYSLYRFDNRDRAVVIVMFFCLTVIWMGIELNQTSMFINPHMVMNPITTLSYIFYLVYAFYCLLPMSLQAFGAIRNEIKKKRAFK